MRSPAHVATFPRAHSTDSWSPPAAAHIFCKFSLAERRSVPSFQRRNDKYPAEWSAVVVRFVECLAKQKPRPYSVLVVFLYYLHFSVKSAF
uniref:Uncharacterized protein n=1 Tax=Steinernema glaseri TaxID=37863 RepID=A0A1I7Z8F4_9BILA